MNDDIMKAYIGALVQAKVTPEDLIKAFTQSATSTSGLTYYDLEEGAKLLFPVITPLIQMIPRVKGKGGTATNWRSVTGLNTANVPMGVAEGLRGGIVTTSTQDNTASYVTLGMEDTVSFEADLAAVGFEDLKALAVANLLRASRIGEERTVIGGQGTFGLGTAPTVTATGSTTGGALATGTFHIRVVALTLAAFNRATLLLGVPTTQSYTRGDGTTQVVNAGASQVSADATFNVASGSTGSATATWTAVPGAVGYAVFVGAAGGAAGAEVLNQLLTVNAATITAVRSTVTPGTGFADVVGTAFNTDQSRNTLVFDGLFAICAKSGSNAYNVSLNNGTLTADAAGGIVEINTALKDRWDNYRISPTHILVNSQELDNITKKVIAAGGVPLFRFLMDGNAGNAMQATAGTVVGTYLNRFSMEGGRLIKIMLHPDVPAGSMIFYSDTIPYPISGVQNILQIKTRREWYQLEWPLRNRQYEYGVYVDEVLQCYFPPAFGLMQNIKNG